MDPSTRVGGERAPTKPPCLVLQHSGLGVDSGFFSLPVCVTLFRVRVMLAHRAMAAVIVARRGRWVMASRRRDGGRPLSGLANRHLVPEMLCLVGWSLRGRASQRVQGSGDRLGRCLGLNVSPLGGRACRLAHARVGRASIRRVGASQLPSDTSLARIQTIALKAISIRTNATRVMGPISLIEGGRAARRWVEPGSIAVFTTRKCTRKIDCKREAKARQEPEGIGMPYRPEEFQYVCR